MAKDLLKRRYEFLSRYTDPNDDRIVVEYYNILAWEFDTLSKDAYALPPEPFSFDVGGPVPFPDEYSRPTDDEFFNDCEGTTYRGFYHNGAGGVVIVPEENATACGYTAPPPAGTVLRYECRNADGSLGGVDRYRIVANGTGGETAQLQQRNSPVCGYVPPAPVRGCTDPEATNYNELATEDDGTCTYVPRLDVYAPPRLAALGRPLLFALQSAETGRVPARARLLLVVGNLLPGTVLTLQGEAFTAAAGTPGPGEFNSGITLATVLASSVTLSARYRVSQPDPASVELVALAEGAQFTPEATVNDAAGGLELTLTPGVDGLRSQTKEQWGCYAEVWAVPVATWGGEVDLDSATFVDRLEQLYRPGNRYEFDLAPALVPLVGHSPDTSTDRLVAYFVRFGEVYVPDGEQLRRRMVVADTDVCWGLECAVPVPPLAAVLPLSAPMPEGRVPLSRPSYPERVYVLAEAGSTVAVQLATRSVTGQLSTRSRQVTAAGGVETLELGPLLSQVLATGLRSTLTVLVDGQPQLSHMLLHEPARFGLQLLSQRGVYETVWFTGLVEPAPKRAAQLYAQGTSQAVRRVELTRARKLASGPLTRAGLDWLCDELATSPVVLLLEADGAPAPVVVTGFAPEYNEPENSYSLSLDVEPCPPTYTLSA